MYFFSMNETCSWGVSSSPSDTRSSFRCFFAAWAAQERERERFRWGELDSVKDFFSSERMAAHLRSENIHRERFLEGLLYLETFFPIFPLFLKKKNKRAFPKKIHLQEMYFSTQRKKKIHRLFLPRKQYFSFSPFITPNSPSTQPLCTFFLFGHTPSFPHPPRKKKKGLT